MYITISIRKLVKDRNEAEKFLQTIRGKVKDQEKTEIFAQCVDKMCQEMTTPCDPITS